MNVTGEIDLSLLFSALLRKIWLIILCAVIAGAAAWGYTNYLVTPMYQAKVSIYVNNSTLSYNGSTIPASITASDLSTSQRLVATYVSILKSERVLSTVAEEVGSDLDAEEIRSMLTAASVDDTEVFEVRISNPDPHLAAEIANAIASVVPAEISEIVTGSSTKIIDYASVPRYPYSPSLMQNVILGVGIGVVLAVVIVILQVLMDVRVRDEADLAKISSAPVLGKIPDFAVEDRDDAYENTYTSDKNGKAVEK